MIVDLTTQDILAAGRSEDHEREIAAIVIEEPVAPVVDVAPPPHRPTKPTTPPSYPALVILINRETGDRYEARAISHAEEPDLDRDIGACCYLDRRPRYLVAGVEDPTFDTTIPEDIAAHGWYWHGSFLTHYKTPPPEGCGIVIGMPLHSLDQIWTKARAFIATSARPPPRRSQRSQRSPSDRPRRHPRRARWWWWWRRHRPPPSS